MIAALCTTASLAGALLGYWIGFAIFEAIGQPILAFYGMQTHFAAFAESYNAYGAWAVLIAGVTPFPFKVITILSGATGLNLGLFLLCGAIARGARFFIVAALLWKFGTPIRDFIERRLGLVFTIALALLLGGFYLVGSL